MATVLKWVIGVIVWILGIAIAQNFMGRVPIVVYMVWGVIVALVAHHITKEIEE